MEEAREARRGSLRSVMVRVRCMVGFIVAMAATVLGSGSHDHSGHGHGGSGSTGIDMLDCLPDEPVCVDGVYPLFKSQSLANAYQEGDGSSHVHEVGSYSLYMPNGDYCPKRMGGQDMCASHDHDHSGHHHRRAESMSCPSGSIDGSGIAALPETAVCIDGYYPMYKTSTLARAASPDSPPTAHSHTWGDFTLFMPDGVAMVHDKDGKCPAGSADHSDAVGLPRSSSSSSDALKTEVLAAIIGGSIAGALLLGLIVRYVARQCPETLYETL